MKRIFFLKLIKYFLFYIKINLFNKKRNSYKMKILSNGFLINFIMILLIIKVYYDFLYANFNNKFDLLSITSNKSFKIFLKINGWKFFSIQTRSYFLLILLYGHKAEPKRLFKVFLTLDDEILSKASSYLFPY